MINELEKLVDEIRSYEYDIMKFQRSNPLKDFVNTDPIVEGHYLTIRLGLQGIYTSVNYWKSGGWMAIALDGSNVIARTREPLKLKNYEQDT